MTTLSNIKHPNHTMIRGLADLCLGPKRKKPPFLAVFKRRRPDSNRRMEVLQTSALPLGYVAT